VGAVTAAWFIPLLGLTLAAFVLVDVGVSALTRRRAAHLT
jgi:hypothetical protein